MPRILATATLMTLLAGMSPAAWTQAPPAAVAPSTLEGTLGALEGELVARHGEGQRVRIHRGLGQAARFWRAEDGTPEAFSAFARDHFAPEGPALDGLFGRLEFGLESLDGHMNEIGRDFRWYSELDLGPMLPVDDIMAGYDPAAHTADDFFADKLAFAVLLNFPMTTLDERLASGASWTSRQWAEARLVDRFDTRVPAAVNQAMAEATGEAEKYIAGYNIWMHHLVDAQGRRAFPPKLRLLSHWNLRDEIKSQYPQGAEGFQRQRTIQKVMERIVTQTIPACVIDNPLVDWNPWTNTVAPSPVKDSDRAAQPGYAPTAAPEPDTRYKVLQDCYLAARQMDPYCPTAPTHMARSFEQGRQIPEARATKMLQAICESPLVPRVARIIQARLGRKLEPFDIWFDGFRPGSALDTAKLDALVRARYPDTAAYKRDMPHLLEGLGFSPEKAAWLAGNIEVDPARGSGHAMGAQRRGDHPHLRTRVGKDGMDYKGFNIAVHEMGHNVEQSFSLNEVEHTLMAGVPNSAFTEALAFTFQARDLQLLGQPAPDARARAEKVLNDFWMAYEIAGVGLVDTAAWHWMYDHPQARPAELREAVLSISQQVWNQYYAPVFGTKDCVLLGIYSHLLYMFLYLPDYPLGHMIAFQIERQMDKTGKPGEEFERMARQGRLTPDLWMIRATGQPVGPEALLEAAAEAIRVVR
jgi:hypothetical protein